MQRHIKTLKVHNDETSREDSGFEIKVQRVRISDEQRIMRANQHLPFYRGHFPARGIKYSPLND